VGGFYKKHVDVPTQNGGWHPSGRCDADGGSLSGSKFKRCVSFLVYLNKDWDIADGGRLRIFDGAAEDDGVALAEVVPEGGTLVVFRSDAVPHEVLPTHRARSVVVGWFRTHTSHAEEAAAAAAAAAATPPALDTAAAALDSPLPDAPVLRSQGRLAHSLMAQVLPCSSPSVVIDATCGNGNDSLFIAERLGPGSKLVCVDLSEDAVRATRAKLAEALPPAALARVEVRRADHAKLADSVADGSVALAVFNLGYLPGKDPVLGSHDLE
jgi:hypothetical protein